MTENYVKGLFGLGSGNDVRKRAAWARTAPAGLSGAVIGGNVRLDEFGHLIRWQDYGDYQSRYGWEIDHVQPSALGGSDYLSNLRALHCRKNRSLGGVLGALLNHGGR